MKFFAILLCIAIGSVFGELERRQFARENLEITEDDNEVSSLIYPDDDRKTADSTDKSLGVKYTNDNYSLDQIAVGAKDTDSAEQLAEQLASRNSSSVIKTSTVKPSSSKAMKKNLEIMYSWKPAKYFKTLRKAAKPEDTRSDTKMITLNEFLESFLRNADASYSRIERWGGHGSKAGAYLRGKRDASADDAEKYPVKFVEDPTSMVQSLKTYRKLRDTLPPKLKRQIINTDKFEDKLLKFYAKNSGRAPDDLYGSYYSSVKKEQNILVGLTANSPIPDEEAWKIVNNYKALRKGVPLWNFIGLRPSLQAFLKDDSTPGFAQYMVSKHDEFDDIYLESLIGKDVEYFNDAEGSKFNSVGHYGHLIVIGSEELTDALKATDEIEKKILGSCGDTGKIPKELVDEYKAQRGKEIQLFKNELANSGLKKRRLNLGYRKLRKGTPWYFMKFDFKGVFQQESACRSEYETLKKEELQNLGGSDRVEEASKKDENAKAEAIEKASSQTKAEKNYRKLLKAEVAELSRAEEEDEKVEEMRRGVRIKETETVGVEYDAYRENVENVIATSDVDAKGSTEVHGGTDNVTETTTDTKTKVSSSSHLLRFLILFALVVQVITAILILGPQRDKLAGWCNRKQKTGKSGHAETDPLQAGENVFVAGSHCKISISSQCRLDEADENQ